MALDEVSEQLLNNIFSAFIKSPDDGLDARKYRADNDQFITELDYLEQHGYLNRTNNIYFFRPLALAVLSKENIDAKDLVNKCDLVFHLLRGAYKDNPGQKMTGTEIANKTGLTGNDVKLALAIIIRTPILASYSSNPFKDNAYIEPSESILKYKSFEDVLNELQEGAKMQDKQYQESKPPARRTQKSLANKSISSSTSKTNWEAIEKQFGVTKNGFGRKINFVSDIYKREIIFRDVEHSSVLANLGFSKPAVILAGSVTEELLRLYLEYKNISPLSDNFDGYIRTCEQNGLLKGSVSRLSHAVRQFRNLVHLSAEKTKKHTISKATAIGAVSSIFTIADDF